MVILILGKEGMVAHMMAAYLSQKHTVTARSIRNEVDLTGDFDVVINCTGILVQESLDHMDRAVYVNSYIPHLLEAHFKYTKTKVIQISTDCVFDNDFYGRSKNLGEIENKKDLTLRMSIVGADKNPQGTGLFNWFMQQKGEVGGYEHALWNGITNLQLAKSIEQAMELTGVYNLVQPLGISKYNLLRLINEVFDKELIITPIEQGYDKRLPPGDKIRLPDYITMFNELKEWINEHPALYVHYR